MDPVSFTNHRLRNVLQSFLLIIAMTSLLALSSRLLFGAEGWLPVPVVVLIVAFTVPSLSPTWLLRMYQAKPIHAQHGYPLSHIVQQLSVRAGLAQSPQLYWIPSHTLNAFTVGSGRHAAIAVTHGLLELLSTREMAAVLAHEISHIRHHDTRIMSLADMMTRLTHLLSMTGLLTMLITLPLQLTGYLEVSLGGLVVLVIMPTISALLQLGLSRVREFDADLGAARLTGDPAGLASALNRIDRPAVNFWQRIFMPGYQDSQPSALRSHPPTGERIKRLMSLREQGGHDEEALFPLHNARLQRPYPQIIVRRPRRGFLNGLWR